MERIVHRDQRPCVRRKIGEPIPQSDPDRIAGEETAAKAETDAVTEPRELSDAGGVRGRVGRDGVQGQSRVPGMGPTAIR